jgi:hypothetical protein
MEQADNMQLMGSKLFTTAEETARNLTPETGASLSLSQLLLLTRNLKDALITARNAGFPPDDKAIIHQQPLANLFQALRTKLDATPALAERSLAEKSQFSQEIRDLLYLYKALGVTLPKPSGLTIPTQADLASLSNVTDLEAGAAEIKKREDQRESLFHGMVRALDAALLPEMNLLKQPGTFKLSNAKLGDLIELVRNTTQAAQLLEMPLPQSNPKPTGFDVQA